MLKGAITRRNTLRLSAAAAALPLVHIRTAAAAGKLSIAFWDHWVPGGNDIMQKQVNAWAEKNKVEVNTDFITGNGGKLSLTGAAEVQAKTGHDVMTFFNWDVHNYAAAFEPVDDVMKRLTAANGDANPTCEYLAKKDGHWVAVPTSTGTQTKPPCARISWFKQHGLDLQAMYPNKPEHTKESDGWTYDAFLKYASWRRRRTCISAWAWAAATTRMRPTCTAPCSRPMAHSWWTERGTANSSPTTCASSWSSRSGW